MKIVLKYMIIIKIIKLFIITTILFVCFSINLNASSRKAYFYGYKHLNFKKNPKRIVSLAPIVTEILFALKLDQKIVGVTKFCDRPIKAKYKVKIGGFIDPQLEAILALKPDLVIAPKSIAINSILKQIARNGVPVLVGFVETLPEIYDFLLKIGSVTKKTHNAKILLKNSNLEIKLLKNSLLNKNNMRLNILLILSVSELIVAGPKTFASKLLTYMGANCPVKSKFNMWPMWSIEKLFRNIPDVIIIMQGNLALERFKTKFNSLLRLKSFKSCRLLASNKAILMRPGIYLHEDGNIVKNLIYSDH